VRFPNSALGFQPLPVSDSTVGLQYASLSINSAFFFVLQICPDYVQKEYFLPETSVFF
jgi:hypothetical protein